VYVSYVTNTEADFLDCLFAGNTAHYGGAAYFDDNAGGEGVKFTNCTFADNKSPSKNGDVLHFFKYGEGGSPEFRNCVLAKTADAPFTVHDGTVDDIIFQNTLSAYPAGTLGTNGENADNIENADPGFKDPGGGDYGLSAGSPAINAGSYHVYPVELQEFGGSKDLAGVPRMIGDIDIGAYEYATPEQEFLILCGTGTPERIQAAIDAGADVNAQDEYCGAALTNAAASNENPEVISVLVKAGADVNAKGAVPILLKAGLVADAKDDFGVTALMYAGSPEVVSLLLEAGADVNAKDDFGMTALMYAGIPEVIDLLLEAGADVNATDEDDRTALMFAARDNDPEVVSALIKAGADVNAKDKDGETVLKYADENEAATEVISILKKAGAK
jgi:predicted component of type VI protein secretion system